MTTTSWFPGFALATALGFTTATLAAPRAEADERAGARDGQAATARDSGQGDRGPMGGGMMGGSMEDMRAIHGLLAQHEKIERTVKDIPNGVETVTTSEDAQVSKLIREHVRQMKARIQEGRPIRQMDPLFRELFDHHEHIAMTVVEVPGGVRVVETADTPEVVSLVRQHARRAVSEFVAQGMRRAMRPTPLPDGYVPAEARDDGHAAGSRGCRCMGST